MYSIRTEHLSGIQKLKLVNEQSGEYLSVVPVFGGNLNELVLQKNGKLHSVIDGDKALETLSVKNANHYQGAKLSPFPNRINKGKYQFNGLEYQLAINSPPHAMHGLCWNRPFTKKSELVTSSSAKIILQADYNSMNPGFPFPYHIEREYTLESGNFTCLTRIVNTGKQSMPLGDGWHPYFTTGSKINNIKLQLSKSKQLELSETLIPTGKHVAKDMFTNPTLLNDIVLDYCFELGHKEGIAEIRLIDEQQNVCIVIWQQTGKHGYNFIQAYTPPHRNSIAIEPMSCAPDAFNNKNGLIILPPAESVEFCFGVRLE